MKNINEFDGSGRLEFPEVEAWTEAVDGAALLDEIRGVLKRFTVLPAWGAEALALWAVHTYAFHLRDVTTYVGISSPEKRCGKTTLLTVLSELANRAVVAANISPPALFRVIAEMRPTLLIDEADTFLQGNDEMRGILNSGYTRKTAFVVRVGAGRSSGSSGLNKLDGLDELNESGTRGSSSFPGLKTENGEKGSRLVRYSSWCPKVMAAIGRLPDTLADRCVVITMQRKTAQEMCERLKGLDGTVLRQKCARFVMDHAEAITAAQPEAPGSLNDRATDIWEPLLVIADLAGGEWPGLAREAAVRLTARAQESNPIASLLLDIGVFFVMEKAERLFSRDLVSWLNTRMERPWAEARNGKPITELWVAQQLRPYGIRPKTLWIGETAAKGYMLKDFEQLCSRYVPKAEVEALMEETPDAQGSHG